MSKTRAMQFLDDAGIDYTAFDYDLGPHSDNFALHVADALSVSPDQVLKTLVLKSVRGPIVALVPASKMLNLKKLAHAAGVKKCTFLELSEVNQVTGYVPGGVSPFAQKRVLPTYIDETIDDVYKVVCSGGNKRSQIVLPLKDLVAQCSAVLADITVDPVPEQVRA